MKILLTGAGGFLGKALAAHWGKSHELSLIQGREGFASRLQRSPDCDWLVHAGAEVSFRRDPESLERSLASARAVRDFMKSGRASRLLFVSAAGAAGVGVEARERGEAEIGRTDVPFLSYQQTAYIQGKLRAERIFREAGIPLTVVYPSTVFGAGMNPGTLHSFLHGKLAPPGGSSFLGLPDFIAALDLLLGVPATGEGYLLNGGNLLFAEMFRAARAGKKDFVVLPRVLRPFLGLTGRLTGDAVLSTAVMQSAFGYKYYSAAKFRSATSWSPQSDFGQMIRQAQGARG